MSILDPKFKYVPANATDLKKTFARERARLKAKEEERKQQEAEQAQRVRFFPKVKGHGT